MRRARLADNGRRSSGPRRPLRVPSSSDPTRSSRLLSSPTGHGSGGAVTLTIADPHAAVREGLPLLLREEGIDVVAGCATGEDAEGQIARYGPDLALVAVELRDMDGLALLGRLLRRGCPTAVVLYAAGDETEVLDAAVRAGAAGVVGTARPVAQLVRALRAVAAGGMWFDEEDWFDAPLSPAAEAALRRSDGLSEPERRVLALVAAGTSTDDIGAALSLSPHTVRTHVRNLMRKLDAQSRAHAVAIAMREDAIEVE